jgi:hypothetical protein
VGRHVVLAGGGGHPLKVDGGAGHFALAAEQAEAARKRKMLAAALAKEDAGGQAYWTGSSIAP